MWCVGVIVCGNCKEKWCIGVAVCVGVASCGNCGVWMPTSWSQGIKKLWRVGVAACESRCV